MTTFSQGEFSRNCPSPWPEIAQLVRQNAPEAQRELLLATLTAASRLELRTATLRALAGGCGMPLRTLAAKNHRHGLPPPGRQLRACRLVHASHALAAGRLSISRAAELAGWSDVATLRLHFVQDLHLFPSELRADPRRYWGHVLTAVGALLIGLTEPGANHSRR